MTNDLKKGRGAQYNPHNKFLKEEYIRETDYLNYCFAEGEEAESNKTEYIEIFPKTIINKVDSPDIGLSYSMNPYQGCEHGCIYCYARNTHEYWGYSAGKEFEQKILFKKNAPQLLEKHFQSKNWKVMPIMLSGNTDCYQPIERKLEITRGILEVCLKYKHPVSIITKNSLILRDLDLLQELNKYNLVHVSISITSLNEETRRLLEPRTASALKRLETVRLLSAKNIPVNVMVAPVIPAINSHELFDLVKAISEAGALGAACLVVRLNGQIGDIFTDWVIKSYPDRAEKILNQIKSLHGGNLNDSRFGARMKGDGKMAETIHKTFKLAKQKYGIKDEFPSLDCELFYNQQNPQMRLF